MSLPTGSVPNRWPWLKGSMLALRMLPPVGLPTGPISGQTKKADSSRTRIPPGIAMSSEATHLRRRTVGSPAAGARVSAGTCPSASGSCALIADPRVEDGVKQVCDEVAEHDDDRQHEDDALHDEDVAVVDRLQQRPSYARQREDRLDDHGDADERADVQAHDGQQAEQRVGQRVA